MPMPERLDKLVALQLRLSRKEAAALVRGGAVHVDGAPARDPARRADPAAVTVRGQPLGYRAFVYLMLHKPAGVLTAARDRKQPTVLDCIDPALLRRGVQPVGRLDKDTTGLLLLTDNGQLAHRLLSPRHHVWKVYRARLSNAPAPDAAGRFAAGLALEDFTCLPARLRLVEPGAQPVWEVSLREGRFHQVKRMCAAVGAQVVALERVAFGPLRLDPALRPGECRPLTPDEQARLLDAD